MKSGIMSIIFIVNISLIIAHPTGDMVFTDNKLLWSYVCPVGNIQHKACVMIWDRDSGVRPWLTSEYSGSDWMISVADSKNVYLIERYYNQNEQAHFCRLLYSEVETEPTELIPWFRDDYRFGEHGFVVLDKNTILFARYPSLYKFNMDQSVEILDSWEMPINSIRNTNDGNLVIQSDSNIWLTDIELNILQSWSSLLEPLESNQPFGGNRISDADFSNGNLYLSYWGKRRFDVIKNEERIIVKSFNSPWTPHHVAVDGSRVFMLSSTIAPDVTNNIEPSLWLLEKGKFELIWGDSGIVTNIQTGNKKNEFKLIQNYPNPFNPGTIIKYSIPSNSVTLSGVEESNITLKVYDILGREVVTLVNENQKPGNYEVNFDASGLTSGIYFYKLKSNAYTKVNKMMLLK